MDVAICVPAVLCCCLLRRQKTTTSELFCVGSIISSPTKFCVHGTTEYQQHRTYKANESERVMKEHGENFVGFFFGKEE